MKPYETYYIRKHIRWQENYYNYINAYFNRKTSVYKSIAVIKNDVTLLNYKFYGLKKTKKMKEKTITKTSFYR